MRKFIHSSLCVAIVASLIFTSCKSGVVKGPNGVVYKNAVEYNDYIITRQTKLIKNFVDFGKAAQENLDSAEHLLDRAADMSTKLLTEIKGMAPFKSDSSFRDAAVRSFEFYHRVLSKDYKDLLNLRRKSDEGDTEATSAMQDLVARVSKEEEGFDKTFHNAQKTFATDNHMELIDNSMQKEIDKMGQ